MFQHREILAPKQDLVALFDTLPLKPYYSDVERFDFMSTADAAKMLRISRQTLYNWLAEGKVPEPSRNPRTGHLQWKAEDVQRIRRIRETGGEE
jgi:excisionase family DNA binding protein